MSTPAELDAALAARLTAVAAALAGYNNAMAIADAGQTDDDIDSWAAYDTAVNGFITTYWNDEAQSDSDETHLVNAAYVVWANDTQTAWSDYSNDVADAHAAQTLDDALSANTAWYDINYATANWYMDNADAGNAYDDAVVPFVADYYTTMEAAWVVVAVATTNAAATKTITIADAYAAAVGRWADQMAGTYVGIYPGYLADMELANAARRTTQELASAAYQNAMYAAGSVWLETALPAWVTYEDELSDHTVDWVVTSSLAWEICENDIADASLDYTNAAVPVGTLLTTALNGNYSDWVSDVATADETYWNELADHGVTWVASATASDEGVANDSIVNAATYGHAATALDVQFAGVIGESFTIWAGTVAGQLTDTPYTPPATQYTQFAQAGAAGNGVTAYQQTAGQQPQTPLIPPKPPISVDDRRVALELSSNTPGFPKTDPDYLRLNGYTDPAITCVDIGGLGYYRNAYNVNPVITDPGNIPNLLRIKGEDMSENGLLPHSVDIFTVENTPMSPEMTDEIARGIKSGGIISLAADNKFSQGYVQMMEDSLRENNIPYTKGTRRQSDLAS